MKSRSFTAEISFFSLIFLGLVLPPCLNLSMENNTQAFTLWTFPWAQLILAAFATGIYMIFNDFSEKKKNPLVVFPVLFTFCMLFCISLFIKFFSTLPAFRNVQKLGSLSWNVSEPENAVSWLFCLLNFFFSAFYEEVLYRFYLADSLYALFSRRFSSRALYVICEVFAGLCFAAGHVYMGLFSAVYAGIAHVILRICYKKTGRIWSGVCAHFLYNVISLILL